MKSLHESTLKEEQLSLTNHVAFDHQNLFCLKGNQATFLCQNKNCSQTSMICTEKDCECQNVHKKCLKTFSEEFFTEITKKINPTTEIKERVDKIIDDAIDFISNLRDEIYSNLKYLGLNQDEKDLMELLNEKEYNKISGSRVWKICQKIYEEKEISSSYIIKSIKSYWTESQEKFKRCFEKLKELSEKEGKNKNIFHDSSIITTDDDSDNLLNFFEQGISSVKLLYSASKQNYQMRKYHKVCQGKKNTLLIVKGINGKIFGGFWEPEIPKISQNSFGGNVVEISPKSFVFSLTNKDKLKLQIQFQQNAYQNFDAYQGPNFGNDVIGIYKSLPMKYGKANENPFGVTGGVGFGGFGGGGNGFGGNAFNFGAPMGFGNVNLQTTNAELTEHYCVVLESRIFANDNYESNAESRLKFAGTEEIAFPIKEWEVYQIRFEQTEQK